MTRAICWLVATFAGLHGCTSETLESCRAAAAKMPTDMGVRIAVADCHKKFQFDPSQLKPAN